MGYETGVHPVGDYVAVKVPVFSFEKLHSVDTMLGPEMKSTGEVLGIAKSFDEALYKGLIAAGYQIKHEAKSTMGTLVTLLIYGTVLEERGLTSMTYTSQGNRSLFEQLRPACRAGK